MTEYIIKAYRSCCVKDLQHALLPINLYVFTTTTTPSTIYQCTPYTMLLAVFKYYSQPPSPYTSR